MDSVQRSYRIENIAPCFFVATELQLRDDIGGNSSFHDDSTNEEEVVEAPKVRQCCKINCTRAKRNKILHSCNKCKKPACGSCIAVTKIVCKKCRWKSLHRISTIFKFTCNISNQLIHYLFTYKAYYVMHLLNLCLSLKINNEKGTV